VEPTYLTPLPWMFGDAFGLSTCLLIVFVTAKTPPKLLPLVATAIRSYALRLLDYTYYSVDMDLGRCFSISPFIVVCKPIQE
jgi:hypothetical protein